MARRSLTGDALEQRRQHLQDQLLLWLERLVYAESAASRARQETETRVHGARLEVARLYDELARLEGSGGLVE